MFSHTLSSAGQEGAAAESIVHLIAAGTGIPARNKRSSLKAGSQYTQHIASRRAVSHRAASAPQCIALFGSQLAMRLCASRWVATKSALPPRNY